MKLESIALHEGYKSEATTKAAAVPIYQTTTSSQKLAGIASGISDSDDRLFQFLLRHSQA